MAAEPVQYGQYSIPTADVMVNFGVGQPAPSLLPLARVRRAAAQAFAADDPLFLQYGYISGYPALRKSLAAFLSAGYGQPVDPDALFVTNGVTGALGLIVSLFGSRGDVIVCENPSYFLALNIFRDAGLSVAPMPLDADGLDTAALERALRDPVAPLRPRFLYTIPAFQNPTGACLPAARKAHLAALAAEFDFIVLADEVYQLLGLDGAPPPPPPMTYFDGAGGRVISIGSFSKILAPGLRLGWMHFSRAAMPLHKRLFECGSLDSSGAMNPVVSGIVHAAIDSGEQAAHLAAVRAELTRRAATLCAALAAALPPDATFTRPAGGYFVWLRLPPGMSGARLLEVAVRDHRVRFHPGERFGTGLDNFIRLSFSYYSAEDLTTGAARLGDAIRALAAAPPPAPAPAPARAPPPAPLALAVHGATGRLGSLVAAAAARGGDEPDGGARFAYVGPVPRGGAPPPGAAVVVDVSLPDGTAALVARLLADADAAGGARPPALVVGTTGALPLDALRAYARRAPVGVYANFSAGVPLVLTMLAAAVGGGGGGAAGGGGGGWAAEITEMHHTAKVDAPSGTAKRLAAALGAAGVAGAHGEPVPVHSLRLGDAVGTHTVHLARGGERVEVTHTATRRDVFALGALRAAAWVAAQPPGLYFR